jgi:hypothetical protein
MIRGGVEGDSMGNLLISNVESPSITACMIEKVCSCSLDVQRSAFGVRALSTKTRAACQCLRHRTDFVHVVL